MSVVIPSEDGKILVPKPELKALPKEIFIHKILPFMGGVRSIESRQKLLQEQLRTFAREAIDLYGMLAADRRNITGAEIRGAISGSKLDRANRWVRVIEQMDVIIDQNSHRGRPRSYQINYFNFDATKWLEIWIEVDEISMSDLSLFPMEVWIRYMNVYKPVIYNNQYLAE
jgi:hypothetical protein